MTKVNKAYGIIQNDHNQEYFLKDILFYDIVPNTSDKTLFWLIL